MIKSRSEIDWEFNKEILSDKDLENAEAFWKHCLLAGYENIYQQKLIELKNSIDRFKYGLYIAGVDPYIQQTKNQ